MGNLFLISACLAGLDTNYLGRNSENSMFKWMMEAGKLIPFCPEQLGGLPTPRIPCEICFGDGKQVLKNCAKVMSTNNEDKTEQFIKGAYETLKIAQMVKPDLVILKEKSPSCGVNTIYNGNFNNILIEGSGVTTALLQTYGFRIISDIDYIKNFSSADL